MAASSSIYDHSDGTVKLDVLFDGKCYEVKLEILRKGIEAGAKLALPYQPFSPFHDEYLTMKQNGIIA